MKLIDAGKVAGQFKIEVTFGSERQSKGITPYAIMIWQTFDTLTGAEPEKNIVMERSGTETLMAFCPSCPEGIVRRPEETYFESNAGDTGYCGNCKKPFEVKDMPDMKLYRSDMTSLAKRLVTFFHTLKGNCDISLKFHRSDLRYNPGEKYIDKLNKARSDRHPAIYTMQRIMEDTKNGASLEGRFKAFVTA